MIPKSVIELTINVFKNDLEELENVNRRITFNGNCGYDEPSYIKTVRHNIDVYKLLIREYEKYLEESYSAVSEPPPKPTPPENTKLECRHFKY
jgi:hypothetical protein